MIWKPERLAGWGNHPSQLCRVARPERLRELRELSVAPGGTLAWRGLGRSYGDASLNAGDGVVLLGRLNRFREFDPSTGLLECEAGASLADIIACFLPRGFFPPVTPGTRAVTVGGAVACDVHGKNHHRDGAFSAHVSELTLLTVGGQLLRCSRREHPDVFWATVGGMGLTGCIVTVRLALQRVSSAFLTVVQRRTADLQQTMQQLATLDAEHRYTVAWVDGMAGGRSLGRAVVSGADHASGAPAGRRPLSPPAHRRGAVPFAAPNWFLSPTMVRGFGALRYHRSADGTRYLADFDAFFYPLDSLAHWNRLYGRRGFLQYQFVLPEATALEGMTRVLETLHRAGHPPFLAVLKRLGAAGEGLLSFPRAGYTLALDLPVGPPELFALLRRLDEEVAFRGGRVYLAKDARLAPDLFRAMYPQLPAFLALKERLDPDGRLATSLSRRLGITA